MHVPPPLSSSASSAAAAAGGGDTKKEEQRESNQPYRQRLAVLVLPVLYLLLGFRIIFRECNQVRILWCTRILPIQSVRFTVGLQMSMSYWSTCQQA